MALAPFAVKKIIPAGSNDPAIKVIGAILHVDAGNAETLFPYFNGPSGGIESHFHIRKDGVIEQYRDTGREADANLKANSFYDGGVRKGYVSIETQGYGEGEWTPEQIASIKRLLLWLSNKHDFPLVKCATTTSPGVGYHTLFGAPSDWTPVSKSCPGPDRKVQFAKVLVPWMRRETDKPVAPVAPVPPAAPVPPVAPQKPAPDALQLRKRIGRLREQNKALREALSQIANIASGEDEKSA